MPSIRHPLLSRALTIFSLSILSSAFIAKASVQDTWGQIQARHPSLELRLTEDGLHVMFCPAGTGFQKGFEVLPLSSFSIPEGERTRSASLEPQPPVKTAAMAYEEEAERVRESNLKKFGVELLVAIPKEWMEADPPQPVRSKEEQDDLDLSLFSILTPWDYQSFRASAMTAKEKAEEKAIQERFLNPPGAQVIQGEPNR